MLRQMALLNLPNTSMNRQLEKNKLFVIFIIKVYLLGTVELFIILFKVYLLGTVEPVYNIV